MIARRTFLCVLFVAGGSLAAGCAASDDSRSRRRDRDQDGLSDRHDPRPNRPDYPDQYDDRYPDRNDRHDTTRGGGRRGIDQIPRNAFKVTEGTDERLRHEPKLDGRVFVYDVNTDVVIYDTRLHGGERFVVDPGRDSLSIDGKRIDKINLRPSHKYRIYYLRD